MEEKPDVVAFSCYIWNMEYVNRLSEHIKLIDKNIEILYGGPEVSYEGKEFLEESVGDYVIVGEGEATFRDFVKFKLEEKDIENIRGLYYKDKKDKVLFNGFREELDMNKLVFPYEIDDNLDNKIVYYEASRGCPFKCKYCLSSVMNGVRFLDVERVKKELKFFMDNGVELVKFVDRTFNCNKKYSMDIWNFLSRQDTKTRFHFEIAADLLSEEEIEILNKAPKGRFQLEVGVQTSNTEVLKNINRIITFENVSEKVIKVAENKNVIQHLDLIAGLPGEDYNSFRKSFNDVHSLRPDEIQLGFLKLLKGSAMLDEAKKWGIVYSPYAPYEILKNKDLSYDNLLELKKVEKMVDKYYNSGKFNNALEFFLSKFDTPFEFYFDLAMYFDKIGYFKRSLGNVEYYKVLLDFNREKFIGKDEKLLKEIIKYDYLCFNKKKWLPNFLLRDISKEEERDIRVKLKEKHIYIKPHIEKFKLDIFNYIDKREEIWVDNYVIFNEEEFGYRSNVKLV